MNAPRTFADWHRLFRQSPPANVIPINRGWEIRRERQRKHWLATNTRPMS